MDKWLKGIDENLGKGGKVALSSLQVPVLTRFFQNMNSFMNSHKLNFKPAKVWRKRDFFYILFYWRPDYKSEFKRYKKSFDLNRIADLHTRAIAANVMAETVNQCLAEGWSPERGKLPNSTNDLAIGAKDTALPVLLDFAQKTILQKTEKQRTISSYTSHFKQFVDYLKKKKQYNIEATEFSRLAANDYQSTLIAAQYAAKTINTKIEYANNLFAVLVRMDFISENPFSFIKNLKVNESQKHQLYTRSEMLAIKNHLLKNTPELWQFALMIYYCYMRPESIMHMKVGDIDTEKMTISIAGENHKNGLDATKQILSAHAKYLLPYIENLPKDYYLFSKKLKPGPDKQPPTRAAESWAKHVKQELGINKTAYGLKHTGAAHFLENNSGQENLKWLQMQMAHADLQTTSIYTNKLKTVTLNENATVIEEF